MEDCGRVRIVVLTIKVFVLKIVLGLIGILGAICVRGEVVHDTLYFLFKQNSMIPFGCIVITWLSCMNRIEKYCLVS